MGDLTDRQELEIKIKSTIQFNFGTICDTIDRTVTDDSLAHALKRVVRNNGNDAIRIISNHLEHVNVSRNHRKDGINAARVARRAVEG